MTDTLPEPAPMTGAFVEQDGETWYRIDGIDPALGLVEVTGDTQGVEATPLDLAHWEAAVAAGQRARRTQDIEVVRAWWQRRNGGAV